MEDGLRAEAMIRITRLIAFGCVGATLATAMPAWDSLPPPPRVDTIRAERVEQGRGEHPTGLAAEVFEDLLVRAEALRTRIVALRIRGAKSPELVSMDDVASVEVHLRHIIWTLRYETELQPGDLLRLERALEEGRLRAASMEQGKEINWSESGVSVRGFYSRIDGSAQAFGLVVPSGLAADRPAGMDVVLHGSMRPLGGAALRFAHRFLGPKPVVTGAGQQGVVEVHPYGRGENGYRWAGETDIFEAIDAAQRNLRIDGKRIVLRGFSMGASGTWHVGLKHPGFFAGLAPYCGYVDTLRFSASSNPRFVRVQNLPSYQEAALQLNDAIGYAANAWVVPVVAAMGEHDPGFINHTYMEEAFAAEGLRLDNLISPGTAHRIDPAVQAEQLRRIAVQIAARPLGAPLNLRFVTWSLKYASCHWLELRELERHYARAEIAAELGADGVIRVTTLHNIMRFAIDVKQMASRVTGLEVLGERLTLPATARRLVISREAFGWICVGLDDISSGERKRPGLQGPIDDAFTGPFLCVRGTGKPWHPQVAEWAEATFRRFAYEWARYMGGELPVKNDNEVTPEDLRTKHLILFGDPGSNLWIREALPGLPIEWTPDMVGIRERTPAATHAPVLVCASPLSGADDRYLVLNSGHTFHETELATLNYLLFPRLGDWALVEIGPGVAEWQQGSGDFPERVAEAGFFDEQWRP